MLHRVFVALTVLFHFLSVAGAQQPQAVSDSEAGRATTQSAGAPKRAARGDGLDLKLSAKQLRGVRALALQSSSGEVRLRAQRGEQLVVKAKRNLGGELCGITHAIMDGTVKISATSADGGPCEVDLVALVPAVMDVAVEANSGNVFISGTQGKVALTLSQGNAVIGGRIALLDVAIAQGSLSAQGVGGQATLKLGHGNAQLFYGADVADLDTEIGLDLDVALGNVTVTAPMPQATLNVTMGHGQVTGDIEQVQQANWHIRGSMGSGNLQLRKAR